MVAGKIIAGKAKSAAAKVAAKKSKPGRKSRRGRPVVDPKSSAVAKRLGITVKEAQRRRAEAKEKPKTVAKPLTRSEASQIRRLLGGNSKELGKFYKMSVKNQRKELDRLGKITSARAREGVEIPKVIDQQRIATGPTTGTMQGQTIQQGPLKSKARLPLKTVPKSRAERRLAKLLKIKNPNQYERAEIQELSKKARDPEPQKISKSRKRQLTATGRLKRVKGTGIGEKAQVRETGQFAPTDIKLTSGHLAEEGGAKIPGAYTIEGSPSIKKLYERFGKSQTLKQIIARLRDAPPSVRSAYVKSAMVSKKLPPLPSTATTARLARQQRLKKTPVEKRTVGSEDIKVKETTRTQNGKSYQVTEGTTTRTPPKPKDKGPSLAATKAKNKKIKALMDEIKEIEKKAEWPNKLSAQDKARVGKINKQIKELGITRTKSFRKKTMKQVYHDPDIFLQGGGKIYRRNGGALRGWGAAKRGF